MTLMVNVRESTGAPLEMGAIVKLDSYAGALHTVSTTREGSIATFAKISPGDYNVEVSAPGYETTTERISVMGAAIAYPVYIYVQQASSVKTPNVPGNPTIMSPRLQEEIDKALEKLRKQQYDAARGRLEKAAKMAPGNPDVQYLFGMLEYKQGHMEAAQKRFEGAISLYSSHAKSYLVLGELLLRTGHAAEAAQTLEKAYQLNGADWRVHLLLADAYVVQKQYDKAEPHAARAVELGKSNGAAAELLLGRIFAAEGKKEGAIRAFRSLLRDFPNDSVAAQARAGLDQLEGPLILPPVEDPAAPSSSGPAAEAKASSAPSPEAPSAVLPPAATPARAWAPPDIDAKEYPLASDVVCGQEEILHRAQIRSKNQLANFERFTATEHIVHQEVGPDGAAGQPKSRDFTYLVFVEKSKDGTFYLDEQRDGGQNLNEFPSHLASTGLVSLGVAVFREELQQQLAYKCEGLGKWRGQPAWQIRFEESKDAPARLRTWRNAHGTYRLPLKGRVWVSANTYDVLHLETDLLEPQQEIDLKRDHLIVDYGPVQFQKGKTSLWLPWYAELFMELHGKRYHHRHTLTNYEMFSVDTNNSISVPDSSGGGNR